MRRNAPRQLIAVETQLLQTRNLMDILVYIPRQPLIAKPHLRHAIRRPVIHQRNSNALPRMNPPTRRPIQLPRARRRRQIPHKRIPQRQQRRAIPNQPRVITRIRHRHPIRANLRIPIRAQLAANAIDCVKRPRSARPRHHQRNRHQPHHNPQRNPRRNPKRPLIHNLALHPSR